MKNPKAQIHADWLEAKAKTEKLRSTLDDLLTINRKSYMKLYAEAIEIEQNLYFELTGKREPKQKKLKHEAKTRQAH